MRTVWIIALASVGVVACGKDSGGDKGGRGGGKAEKVAPPFTITIEKVEHHEQLAPNKTYEEQGLGKKPAEGNVFSCVFYKIENTASEEKLVSVVHLVDAADTRTPPSTAAAGSLPSEWKHERISGKLAPGASASQINCYEVAKPGAAAPMKLLVEDTGWGPKNPPWELVTPLP
jgi:hypothetical protein